MNSDASNGEVSYVVERRQASQRRLANEENESVVVHFDIDNTYMLTSRKLITLQLFHSFILNDLNNFKLLQLTDYHWLDHSNTG